MPLSLEIIESSHDFGENSVQKNKQIELVDAIKQMVTKITDPDKETALGETLLDIYNSKTDIDIDEIPPDHTNSDYPHTKKQKKGFASYLSKRKEQILPCNFEFYVSKDGNFIKLYVYDDNEYSNVIESKILAEIYFQQKASAVSLHQSCSFKVPHILSYGIVNKSNSANTSNNSTSNSPIIEKKCFYIKMENIKGVTIDTKKDHNNCPFLQKKVYEIDKCLKDNDIFHNDLNSGNIMIDSNDNIIIIDFGEATEKVTQFETVRKYCDPTKSKKTLSRKTSKSRKTSSAESSLAREMDGLYSSISKSKYPGGSIKRRLHRKTKKIHIRKIAI